MRQAVNKMKAAEVLKLDEKALEAKLTDLKKDLFFLRMQHATNQLDNPIKIAETKRDIARVKTVIRQRQLGL
jgi:large subunit ribosomal protein L29